MVAILWQDEGSIIGNRHRSLKAQRKDWFLCHRDLRTQFPRFTNAAAGAQIVRARPASLSQDVAGSARDPASWPQWPHGLWSEADAALGPSEEAGAGDLPALSCLPQERPASGGVFCWERQGGRINGGAKAGGGVGWGRPGGTCCGVSQPSSQGRPCQAASCSEVTLPVPQREAFDFSYSILNTFFSRFYLCSIREEAGRLAGLRAQLWPGPCFLMNPRALTPRCPSPCLVNRL